jgi:glycosyltransferase 2 family protein
VRTFIRIAVSALLLIVIAWRTDWNAVAEEFAHLRVEMWLMAFSLYVLAQIASARRWQLFARALGFEHTLPQYCGYFFIGLYFSLVLPTLVGGDVMRIWYLDGGSGRKRSALGSVFLERVNGLLVLIATACLGVLISPVELPGWIVASVWGIAGCAGLGLASVPILKRWQRLSSERRHQLQLFADLMRAPKTLFEASVMSILVQACGVLILWCLGLGLGVDVPLAYYCVLVPMVSLLMLLPISVNGMGVREAGIVLFLLPLGVAESAALSLAFLWFITGVAVSLIGGVVYLCGTDRETASLIQEPRTK